MIRTINSIPMSSPAAVRLYSIAFRMDLFMRNHLHTLFRERLKSQPLKYVVPHIYYRTGRISAAVINVV
jgi:hypothetical protein